MPAASRKETGPVRLMALTDTIFNFALGLISQTGYTGIFLLMVMESATLPVPSEIVLPLAGYLVYTGQLEYWTTVIVASVGSMIGTVIDYAIGYYLGRPAILRYGRWVRLSQHHLERSESWFRKYGNPVVLLARFVPLVRTVIAFPAGIAKMSLTRFLAYSAVGIIVWDALLIYLGMVFGQNERLIVTTLESTFTLVEIVAVAALLVGLYFYSRRNKTKN
jgi:membrane protein DedA with SNARE-associated domain